MHDRFKKRHQRTEGTSRVRRQIAVEAARRMYDAIGPVAGDEGGRLRETTEGAYYLAKRRAAAVLGHRVRPGDLPSDAEVRDEVLGLWRSRSGIATTVDEPEEDELPPDLEPLADRLDRFALYRMRLGPLESVKQNPRYHPEGDALYHSLQVFELAREARPYDEEFLLAALLHDIGKAIDPRDHVSAAVESLRGAVTDRTLWLIEHHMDLLAHRERAPGPRGRKALEDRAEFLDDLTLLRELDDRGRVPGAPVGTIDQAIDYVKGLEREEYLDG